MKSIKIPVLIHKELKIFTASNDESISDVAGYAIMKYLKARGHKFANPKKMIPLNPHNKNIPLK